MEWWSRCCAIWGRSVLTNSQFLLLLGERRWIFCGEDGTHVKNAGIKVGISTALKGTRARIFRPINLLRHRLRALSFPYFFTLIFILSNSFSFFLFCLFAFSLLPHHLCLNLTFVLCLTLLLFLFLCMTNTCNAQANSFSTHLICLHSPHLYGTKLYASTTTAAAITAMYVTFSMHNVTLNKCCSRPLQPHSNLIPQLVLLCTLSDKCGGLSN